MSLPCRHCVVVVADVLDDGARGGAAELVRELCTSDLPQTIGPK
jgi:hypothetical protein